MIWMLCRALRKLLIIKAYIKYNFYRYYGLWLYLLSSLSLSLSMLLKLKIILHSSNGVLSTIQHIAQHYWNTNWLSSNEYKMLYLAHFFPSLKSSAKHILKSRHDLAHCAQHVLQTQQRCGEHIQNPCFCLDINQK